MKDSEDYKKKVELLKSSLNEHLKQGNTSIAYEIAECLFISTENYSYLDTCIGIYDPNSIKKDFVYLLYLVSSELMKTYYLGIYYAKIRAWDLSITAFLKVQSKSTVKHKKRATWLIINASMNINKSSKRITIKMAAKHNINKITRHLKKIDLVGITESTSKHNSITVTSKDSTPSNIPLRIAEDLERITNYIDSIKAQSIGNNIQKALSEGPKHKKPQKEIAAKAKTQLIIGKNIWHRDGDVWQISFQNKSVPIPHIIGMVYIGHLLMNPDKEFSLKELDEFVNLYPSIQHTAKGSMVEEKNKKEKERTSISRKGYDTAIDKKALEAYRKEINRLEDKYDIAKDTANQELMNEVREEINKIKSQIRKDTDKYKRRREISSESERMRKRIYNNIKYSYNKIRIKHRSLADYLEKSIILGNNPHYNSDQNIPWDIKF
ncbi:MAG: hypothetical protein ACW98W_17810 [Candidatus Hodarchaeales archaeon]